MDGAGGRFSHRRWSSAAAGGGWGCRDLYGGGSSTEIGSRVKEGFDLKGFAELVDPRRKVQVL